jgi:pimeloyl-ACP methyl ester carboxylesterase
LALWQLGGCSLIAAQAAALDFGHASRPRSVEYAPYEPQRVYQVAANERHPAYAIYAPGDASAPHVPLLVLHGMGGDGPSIASLVLPYAQANGWTVIAPTIPYGDWQDPAQVANEDLRLGPQLATILESVTADTGEALTGPAMVFGFSRGAQEALRFSMFFPERVQAVAAVSAGTYTLPVDTVKTVAGATVQAPYPYGTAGLAERRGRAIDQQQLAAVRFLIGVGGADNREGDVPRQWDPYEGKTRLERATRFGQLLGQLGFQAQVAVMPGMGHEVNGAMLEQVVAFLTQAPPQSQVDATLADPPLPVAPPLTMASRRSLRLQASSRPGGV